jgi:hypothetical protein
LFGRAHGRHRYDALRPGAHVFATAGQRTAKFERARFGSTAVVEPDGYRALTVLRRRYPEHHDRFTIGQRGAAWRATTTSRSRFLHFAHSTDLDATYRSKSSLRDKHFASPIVRARWRSGAALRGAEHNPQGAPRLDDHDTSCRRKRRTLQSRFGILQIRHHSGCRSSHPAAAWS